MGARRCARTAAGSTGARRARTCAQSATATTSRHALKTPCYCPQAYCSFSRSTVVLLDHFADAHGWPCTTELRAWVCVEVQLCDGFKAFSTRAKGWQYLFLLNVALNPFGRAVSVLSLHPWVLSTAPCSLNFEARLRYCCNINHRGDMCLGHNHETTFKVGCTDLSGGLSSSEYSSWLFLDKYVHPHDIRTIMASFDVVRVSKELSLCCINKSDFLSFSYCAGFRFMTRTQANL